MIVYPARIAFKTRSKCKNNLGQLYSPFCGSSIHNKAMYHFSHLFGGFIAENDNEASNNSSPDCRLGKALDNTRKKNGTLLYQGPFSRSISMKAFESAESSAYLIHCQSVRYKSTFPNESPKVEKQTNHTSSSSTMTDSSSFTEEKKHMKKSFVGLFRKYGWTFFGTYMSVYVTTLVSLYACIDTGLLDPTTIANIDLPWHAPSGTAAQDADVREFHSTAEFVGSYLEKFAWTKQYTSYVTKNPHTTNLALAWIATKLTEPIRLAVTIAILPSVSKTIGKKSDNSGVADTTGKNTNDSK